MHSQWAWHVQDLGSVMSTAESTFTSCVDADKVGDVMHLLLDV